jgi:glycine cleavage system H protein
VEFPAELRYTTEDEWVRVVDGVATIGVSDFAQDQLGDVVYVELPAPGRTLAAGEAFGLIESVKAVSDLFSPVSGEVIAHNDALTDQPELVNSSPYGDGWMIRVRMRDLAELDGLLTADAYRGRLPAAG